MADLKISQLGPFSETDVVAADVLALADVSVEQTKKITASDLVKAGARLNADIITFGNDVVVTGDLTVNGTTTTINTQDLLVEDKNIVIGNVTTPSDITANGGGITLKGATDKTFNWVDATDAWTSSENLNLAPGKFYYVGGLPVILSDGTVAINSTSRLAFLTAGATYVGFAPPTTVATSTVWTLPNADGTSGQALTTDGSGNLAWVVPGVTSVTGTAPVTSSGGATPDIALSLKVNGGLVTETNALAVDLGASSITGTLGVADGGTGQTTYADGELLIGKTDGTLAKATITQGSGVTITNGNGSITINATGTGLPTTGGTLTGDLTLNAQSDLRFADSDSSNWVALQAPATVAGNVTWTLPDADGTSNQVLTTNGSGTLSWSTPAAAGGVSLGLVIALS